MSVVWLGYDGVLGRPVAVKLLTPRYAAHGPVADRMRIEARAAARLSHPHVTAVYDYGESISDTGERLPYVVMELLTGRTLADRLKEGPLPVPAALLVCAQTASALAAAHAVGLVHRDVKPSNVMLTPSGVKVLDFGLAAEAGAATESLLDGEVLGTPAYLAPERLIAGEVVPASDVYGLGLLLYVAVTGRLPWRAETVTEMLSAHWYAEPAPLPPSLRLPRSVRRLYQRALAKDPRHRPTAQEFATRLAEATVRRRHGRSWAAAAVSSTARLPDPLPLTVRAAVPASVRAPVPMVAPAPGSAVADPALPRHHRWGAVALAGSAAVVVAALAGGLLVPQEEAILPDLPVPGVAAPEPESASEPVDGDAPHQQARQTTTPVVAQPDDLLPVANDTATGPGSGAVEPEQSPSAGSGRDEPAGSAPTTADPGSSDPAPADPPTTGTPPTTSPDPEPAEEPSPQSSSGPQDPDQADPGDQPSEPTTEASPVDPPASEPTPLSSVEPGATEGPAGDSTIPITG